MNTDTILGIMGGVVSFYCVTFFSFCDTVPHSSAQALDQPGRESQFSHPL